MIRDTHQQITLKFIVQNKRFYITSVYARCTETDKMELREELKELSEGSSNPWIVGGNFNVIPNAEEKLGGLPFTHSEVSDIAHCVSNSALVELPTTRSKFTWWNGRIDEGYIITWLDRVMVDYEFQDILPSSSVQHLIRQDLDHAPLLMVCSSKEANMVKPLKSLSFLD